MPNIDQMIKKRANVLQENQTIRTLSRTDSPYYAYYIGHMSGKELIRQTGHSVEELFNQSDAVFIEKLLSDHYFKKAFNHYLDSENNIDPEKYLLAALYGFINIEIDKYFDSSDKYVLVRQLFDVICKADDGIRFRLGSTSLQRRVKSVISGDYSVQRYLRFHLPTLQTIAVGDVTQLIKNINKISNTINPSKFKPLIVISPDKNIGDQYLSMPRSKH